MTLFKNDMFALGNRHNRNDSYGEVSTDEPNFETLGSGSETNPQTSIVMPGAGASGAGLRGVIPKMSKVTNNEKTLLLSSDDEFQ